MTSTTGASTLSSDYPNNAEGSRRALGWAALFLGQQRESLAMIQMQNAFLIVSKYYTEKQASLLYVTFGMGQFLFQTPSGHWMDHTHHKVRILCLAVFISTLLTISEVSFVQDYGVNLTFMLILRFLQGAITSLIPPALNGVTRGIVGKGAIGMTKQVAINEMMNHLGTAIYVTAGSLFAYALYPNIGLSLCVISPIACAGALWFLNHIQPDAIDHDVARGLTPKPKTDQVTNAQTATGQSSVMEDAEFLLSSASGDSDEKKTTSTTLAISHVEEEITEAFQASPPFHVLCNSVLLRLVLIVFLFRASSEAVFPLVMQSLAIEDGRNGLLMSGLSITVAQLFMVVSAKICGDHSERLGRKALFVTGLFSLPVRCLALFLLLGARGGGTGLLWIQILLVSTQVLDGVGDGLFETLYILVTSDVSEGTGRFNLALGLTTAAIVIGGVYSDFLGQSLAQDFGYREAFFILMLVSLVPAFFYLLCMPETLPDDANKSEISMTTIKEDDAQGSDGNSPDVTEAV